MRIPVALSAMLVLVCVFPQLAILPRERGAPAVASGIPAHTMADDSVDADAERELLRLANEERAKTGAPPLGSNDGLTQAAREHARLIVEKNKLSHQFSGEPTLRQRLAKTNLRFDRVGENVAYDSTVEGAHRGLMHSPGHRANLLNPEYNTAGIGVVRHGGMLYVAQDFIQRLPALTMNEAERQVAKGVDRARRQNNSAPLNRVASSQLRDLACRMAKADKLDPDYAIGFPKIRAVVAYTAAEPDRLPQGLLTKARDPNRRAMSVGACYAQSASYPSGIYWVVVALY
jgi:uncharacterized protein YkwD